MKINLSLTHLIVFAGILVLPARITVAQNSQSEMDKSISNNIGDPAKFKAVLTGLKQAVQKHDAPPFSALGISPTTSIPRTTQSIRSRKPQVFIARYDRIITPHI